MLTFDEHKEYWLTIEPYVYLCVKGDDLLLYNSASGELRWWSDTHNLAKRATVLSTGNHFPITRMSGKELAEDAELREFVATVQRGFSGELLDVDLSDGEPLQIMPSTRTPRPQNADLDRCVRAATIYLNADCTQGCSYCARAHLQVPCCGKFEGVSDQLPLIIAKELLGYLADRSIPITLVGGNIFDYPFLVQLFDQLAQRPSSARVALRTHLLNVPTDQEALGQIAQHDMSLRIAVPWDFHREDLTMAVGALRKANVTHTFAFLVCTDQDVARAGDAADCCGTASVRLTPFFDVGNQPFFQERVFLKYDRLAERPPSLANIRRNAVVNRVSFGTFVIRCNGDICASVHTSPLGNIRDCTLAEAAALELQRRSVWLRTRGSVAPCNECVFENLCPPLSRYEHAMKRNDLCRIWDGDKRETVSRSGTPD